MQCCFEPQHYNGPFAASGHMVHDGGQAAHWDIQNKENVFNEVALFWMSQWAACPPACTM